MGVDARVADGARSFNIWPIDDSLRLFYLLQASSIAPAVAACHAMHKQYGELVSLQHKGKGEEAVEMHDAMQCLEFMVAEANSSTEQLSKEGLSAAPSTLQTALMD